MDTRFRVGVISSVHGIRGECKVFPTTDDAARFKDLKKVYVGEHEYRLESVRFFKNMVICKFEGIDTPEEIQKLRTMDLMIDRADAVPLEKGENYISDLIGLKVIGEDGTCYGICEDIIPTGANQVMQVKGDKDFLMPYIKQCILDVDLEKGEIKVHMLDGLLDL